MFSGTKITFSIFIVLFSITGFSQSYTTLNNNEGGLPRAVYYIQETDSLKPLKYLQKEIENKIIIKIVGGMEHVRYEQTVSSRQALIEKSEEENVYYITPITDDSCEIVVDINLFEEYYYVKLLSAGKRITKEVIQTYAPKRYMIAYERFEVK